MATNDKRDEPRPLSDAERKWLPDERCRRWAQHAERNLTHPSLHVRAWAMRWVALARELVGVKKQLALTEPFCGDSENARHGQMPDWWLSLWKEHEGDVPTDECRVCKALSAYAALATEVVGQRVLANALLPLCDVESTLDPVRPVTISDAIKRRIEKLEAAVERLPAAHSTPPIVVIGCPKCGEAIRATLPVGYGDGYTWEVRCRACGNPLRLSLGDATETEEDSYAERTVGEAD